MKKFHRLILLSLACYMTIAVIAGWMVQKSQQDTAQLHQVEINRIQSSLQEPSQIKELSLQSYTYVENVMFLDISDQNKDSITAFFRQENQKGVQIVPWYGQDVLLGYLKFIYQEPAVDQYTPLLIVESSLLVMEFFLLGIFIYLRVRLIKPFQRLSELPDELAKGHFDGSVEEEKTQYLGRFLWSISQLKDSLKSSQKRQLELEKEKKQLLLSLSHDIKTPLHLIKLYSKALEEQVYVQPDEMKHAAHQIGEKTKEIEHFVEDIMNSSRENIIDIQVQQGEFYLHDLFKRVTNVYQKICDLRVVDLQMDPFENRLLKGDIDRTQEVFANLFDNAFKYGDGRLIHITCYEEEYCQLIRFYNSGLLIPDEELPHIFESFYRGSSSQGKQGNGLGLYICRTIMRKMDGDLFVEKDKDGMAFTMVFR